MLKTTTSATSEVYDFSTKGFQTVEPQTLARSLPWKLSSVGPLLFGAIEQEANFKLRKASKMGSTHSYTHDPATDTNNKTEAFIENLVAILKLSANGEVDLSISFNWFCRHATRTVPLRFELTSATGELLAPVHPPDLTWDCSCYTPPLESTALYSHQVTLENTAQTFFNLVVNGELIIPKRLEGDKGPVCKF